MDGDQLGKHLKQVTSASGSDYCYDTQAETILARNGVGEYRSSCEE